MFLLENLIQELLHLNLPPNQTYLVGNPYPSALDADEFIKDNLAG